MMLRRVGSGAVLEGCALSVLDGERETLEQGLQSSCGCSAPLEITQSRAPAQSRLSYRRLLRTSSNR